MPEVACTDIVWRMSDGARLREDAARLLDGCEPASATASAFLWEADGAEVAVPCDAAQLAALASDMEDPGGDWEGSRGPKAREVLGSWAARFAGAGGATGAGGPSEKELREAFGIDTLEWADLYGGEDAAAGLIPTRGVTTRDGDEAPPALIRALAREAAAEAAADEKTPGALSLLDKARRFGREAAAARAVSGEAADARRLARDLAATIPNLEAAKRHPELAVPEVAAAVASGAAALMLPTAEKAAIEERSRSSGATARTGVSPRLAELRKLSE